MTRLDRLRWWHYLLIIVIVVSLRFAFSSTWIKYSDFIRVTGIAVLVVIGVTNRYVLWRRARASARRTAGHAGTPARDGLPRRAARSAVLLVAAGGLIVETETGTPVGRVVITFLVVGGVVALWEIWRPWLSRKASRNGDAAE
jgi:hypothetical protein